jgi:2',3'-cyclic-nucleotide 2'-phosphodiesterase (5'-nucleotidase family)
VVILTAFTFNLQMSGGNIKHFANISLIHFNDFHSQYLPFKVKFGDKILSAGIGRLIHTIKKFKNTNSLVLIGGDMLQGTVFSTLFKGEAGVKVLNSVADYMVAGNHEFDYGQENIKKLARLAKFKIFSSNIVKSNGVPFFKENFFLRKINGIKIGIFGLTTTETPDTTRRKNVLGLKFLDEILTAKMYTKRLRAMGANVVVALNHIGFEGDIKLAKTVKGIDVIIGGHSHTKLQNGYRVGNTLIGQAYEYGLYLGIINIIVEKTTGQIYSKTAKLIKISKNTLEDTDTLGKINYYRAKFEKRVNQIIGSALVRLEGSREVARYNESNLGNLIADVMKKSAKTQIAFINGGGIRSSIPRGNISVRNVLRVLPFNNTIYSVKLSGKSILKILSKSAGKAKGDGGFLQVSSGLRIIIKNHKLVSATFMGKRISERLYYSVAVSDFLAEGGDGYREFKDRISILPTGITLSDALIGYITKIKNIKAVLHKRIIRY